MERNAKVSLAIFDEYLNKAILKWNPAEPKKFSGKFFDKPEGWGLPGGVQEPEDEDEVACGIREAKEETGFLVEILEPNRLRIEEDLGDHERITLAARVFGGKMKKNCKWVSLNHPPPSKIYRRHWRVLFQMRQRVRKLRLEKLWRGGN